MSLLSKLFGRRSTQDFARSLAADIAKRYPPHLDSQPGKRPSVNRMTRIVEDTCKKAVEFQGERQLGWLGKATLGNAFAWELRELGYQKDFVDLATEAVIVTLARKKV